MAMKITRNVIDRGDIPEGHVMFQVYVEFNGPKRAMKMLVPVSNQGTRREQSDRGMRHAQELANQFAALPVGRKKN